MSFSENPVLEKEDCLDIEDFKVEYEYIPPDPGRKPGPEKYAKYGDPGHPPEPETVELRSMTYKGVDITPLINDLDDMFAHKIQWMKWGYGKAVGPKEQFLAQKIREELLEHAHEKLNEKRAWEED